MTIQRLATMAALLSLIGAAPAYAQIGASLNATTDVNISSINKASSSAANSSVKAKANASANSAVAATVSSSASTTGSYNTYNGSTGSTSSADVHLFSISRKDLAASTTNAISASGVTTSADFSAYARSLMAADENIAKIETNDTQVSVWYREPAKFLGVVPVTVLVHSSVNADGTVTVVYPWWYELFVKDDTQVQFQADINNTAGTLARGEASTTLSSSAKARLVNALQSIMKTKYQSVSATSSAETY